MEVKEVERVVIAKPVASRPAYSSFTSFSELLAGAMNASSSPANTCSETAVTAIRPKTVRAKPTTNDKPLSKISQAEDYGKAVSSFGNVSEFEHQATVVFKPVAKVVSRRTVSLLANLGSPRITHQQEPLCYQPVSAQHLNQNKPLDIPNPCPCNPHQGKLSQSVDPAKMAQQILEEEPKIVASSSVTVDRPSYDGYNWRKYGQKHVKGSEYPRSYYKCTHPNCPVKKKVERSFDGQITEIVYEGDHNHPKPQPTKRSSSEVQGQGLATGGTAQDHESNDPKSHNICSKNGGPEGRMVNQSGPGFLDLSTSSTSALLSHDLPKMGEHNTSGGSAEDSAGPSDNNKERNKGLEDHDDKPKSKRRKNDDQNNETGTLGVAQEPLITVQNNTETETMGDGFRWRKYGQKVVKGNAYPRSYYRCTSPKCNVRKHVERASDDPNAFITTYEGRHNHEKPMPNTVNSASTEPGL